MCACVMAASSTEVANVADVLAALRGSGDDISPACLFAELVDVLMQAHSSSSPTAAHRSLRDIIYARRMELVKGDLLLLKQLQAAASLTRNVSAAELRRRIAARTAGWRTASVGDVPHDSADSSEYCASVCDLPLDGEDAVLT